LGWGVGVWGLGFGVWGPSPNPQSPIPNPQSPFNIIYLNKYFILLLNDYIYLIYYNNKYKRINKIKIKIK
jgi:hypothetical protein